MSDPLEDARAELAAAPLEDWTTERGRLAKALKADGHADAGKALAKEPKPSAAAWALGWAARAEADAVAEWNGAAAALRQASTDGDGDALRDAMAQQREATERLVGVITEGAEPNGKPLSGAMVDRVRELLAEATADPDGIGGVPPAAPGKGKPATGKPRPKEAAPDPKAEAAARRRAELGREVAEAEREAEEHGRAAQEAEGEAETAQEAARAAAETAREARKAATAAEKAAAKLRRRLERDGG